MIDRPKIGVLIPAAGSGTRMGGLRKQFRELGGLPILHQTIAVFEEHPSVDAIVVAAPVDEVENLRRMLRAAGIAKLLNVVPGGASRQDSVASALAALPPSVEVVLVHDAVRPFLPPDRVTHVIEAVFERGAAALAVPLSDTLRRGRTDVFEDAVERTDLYRMQTPQGFRRDWFEEAHRKAQAEGYQETDDVALVQRLGHSVSIVEGTSTNIKITTPADWELARAIWDSTQTEAS